MINEWLANPTGTDAAREWIELRNVGVHAVSLGGAELRLGPPWALRGRILPEAAELSAGGLLLVGDGTAASRARASGAPVAVTYGAVDLPNDAGVIELWCGPALLARAAYGVEGPAPAPVGGHATARRSEREGDAQGEAEKEAHYCTVEGPAYDGRDQGSPNEANPACVQCLAAGEIGDIGDDGEGRRWRAVRAAQPNELTVARVEHAWLASPLATAAAAPRTTWLTLCAAHEMDLHGVELQVSSAAGPSRHYRLAGQACWPLRAGQCTALPVRPARQAQGECLVGPVWPRAAARIALVQGDEAIGVSELPTPARLTSSAGRAGRAARRTSAAPPVSPPPPAAPSSSRGSPSPPR